MDDDIERDDAKRFVNGFENETSIVVVNVLQEKNK